MAASISRQRAPTPSTPLLETFQKHIEDMRNLVLCKICIKPLYEPYILGCGHTYCYTCLASWFGGAANRRKRKNCPDCRAAVTVQPSPNYLVSLIVSFIFLKLTQTSQLRDLVHMFITRLELLPEDETTKEHDEAQREEARQIETDKRPEGEGLFKGAFTRTVDAGPRLLVAPIRDHEDGVDRCPVCAWELEEGACIHCGYNDDEDDDFSDDDAETRSVATPSIITLDSDLDEDIDEDDHDLEVPDYADGFGHLGPQQFTRRIPLAVALGARHETIDFTDDEDDDDESLTSAGRPRQYYPPMTLQEMRALHFPNGVPQFNRSDSESEGDDTEIPDEQSAISTTDHGDDEDEENDDESMSPSDEETYDEHDDDSQDESDTIHHLPRRDDERTDRNETPSADEPPSSGSFYTDEVAAGNPDYGFSPVREATPQSINSERGQWHPQDTIYRAETQQQNRDCPEVRPVASNRGPRRITRVVISSDEEESDTPTPPRSAGDRRAHLQGQRARRGGAGATRTTQRHYRGR